MYFYKTLCLKHNFDIFLCENRIICIVDDAEKIWIFWENRIICIVNDAEKIWIFWENRIICIVDDAEKIWIFLFRPSLFVHFNNLYVNDTSLETIVRIKRSAGSKISVLLFIQPKLYTPTRSLLGPLKEALIWTLYFVVDKLKILLSITLLVYKNSVIFSCKKLKSTFLQAEQYLYQRL